MTVQLRTKRTAINWKKIILKIEIFLTVSQIFDLNKNSFQIINIFLSINLRYGSLHGYRGLGDPVRH